MTERKETNRIYPFLTMLIALISFFISGIIVGLISLSVNEGLLLILGVPVGNLLMLFILRRLGKDKILAVLVRSELGGMAGFIAGFIIGELLSGGISFIFPSLRDSTLVKSQFIPNIVVLMVADAMFGAFLGELFYGRKSILFFALVCGTVFIPFGNLVKFAH